MKILIINGPNLNLLGLRQPEIYGDTSMEEYLESTLRPLADGFAPFVASPIDLELFQSNSEGELVNRIQAAAYGDDSQRADAIIINAGAYSHYSLAIADALRSIPLPAVEVHISNIYAREEVRHHSVLSECCQGVIAGLGLSGYDYAISFLVEKLDEKNASCK